MIQATLEEIAHWSGAIRVIPADSSPASESLVIEGVSTDTRNVARGQLFVPLAGDRFDGHDYLEAAEAAGAAAALWQQDHPVPNTSIPLLIVDHTLEALQRLAAAYLASWQPRVIGITGSNGKTTTKDLIASVLAQTYDVAKTEGNFNNHIGLPLTILRADRKSEVLVLEMGMSGRGEIAELTKLAKPDVAVITNIGESHLLQLGSRRNIAKAKLEIVEGLKPGGTLIYYGDEPLLQEELGSTKGLAAIRTLTFGESALNDWQVSSIKAGVEGVSFEAKDRASEARRYGLRIAGRHNAVNALAAIAVGRLLGVPDEGIAQGLAEAALTGMRIERTVAWNGAVVLNDAYNASPTSMRAAVSLVGELTGFRRKWLVLGDMLELGPDEADYHAAVGGELAADKTDGLFAYGPLSAHMAKAAASRLPEGAVQHYTDKQALISALMEKVEPDDVVLVKASRGMRLEEAVAALIQGKGE